MADPESLSSARSKESEPILSRAELSFITKQLAILLEAGVGLRQSLEILDKGARYESQATILRSLLRKIEMGWKLSSAMRVFPRTFSRVYIAMVEVGEETGQLSLTLQSLAGWVEGENTLMRRVRASLTYPMLVLAAAGLLTVAFFTVIFPSFAEALSSVPELPLLTRMLILVSDTMRSPLAWFVLISVTVFTFISARQFLLMPENQLRIWRTLSWFPLLGHILRDIGASRFASAMGCLLFTGVDILKSFRLATMASGSPEQLCQLEEGLKFLSEGGDLAAYVASRPQDFTSSVAGLVMAGQESATLPNVFARIQALLADDIEYRLEILTGLFEPFLMTIVAALVGLLVIGIAMPIYGLAASAP